MYYMETGCYCFFYIIKPDKVNYEVRQNPKMLVFFEKFFHISTCLSKTFLRVRWNYSTGKI